MRSVRRGNHSPRDPHAEIAPWKLKVSCCWAGGTKILGEHGGHIIYIYILRRIYGRSFIHFTHFTHSSIHFISFIHFILSFIHVVHSFTMQNVYMHIAQPHACLQMSVCTRCPHNIAKEKKLKARVKIQALENIEARPAS